VPGHERRAGDDEAERDDTGADLERARAIGSPKTRTPPMIAARFAATEVSAITSTAGPS